MNELVLLSCNICGGELTPLNENTYRCVCCGNLFARKQENLESTLKKTLGEEKYARVSAARQNLWAAMHEEYISSETCVSYARELKSYVPSDYYANFAEIANGGNDRELSKFLNESSVDDMKTYADAVLDFMLKQGAMTPSTVTAVCGYINRAYPVKTSPEYIKYINRYEEEATNVDEGIYDLTIPRDVFIAYSSADAGKVTELCEYLESQEITCFTAMRNLRHGRGAADNYDRALNAAIDSCRIIVFVSSQNSRKLGCEALRKELPHVRQKDLDGAPAELKKSYEKLPVRYKKDRVEYLIEDYRELTIADKKVKEFFSGYEWCLTTEDVADRIFTYLTSEPEIYDDSKQDATHLGIDEERLQEMFAEALAQNESRRREEEERRKRKKESHEKEEDERRKREITEKAEREKRRKEDEPIKTKESKGLKYELKDNGYVVTGTGNCEDKDIIIPTEHNGLIVFSIAPHAFYGCSSLTSVIIPASVTSIGDNAFFKCTSLTSVVVPPSVTNIGKGVFFMCKSLSSIIIPDSVTSIGFGVLGNCISLQSVTIPNSVTLIPSEAFYMSDHLAAVFIPASVTSIGDDAFSMCGRLKDVYYSGTQSEWERISVGENNDELKKAAIHYNCKITRKMPHIV